MNRQVQEPRIKDGPGLGGKGVTFFALGPRCLFRRMESVILPTSISESWSLLEASAWDLTRICEGMGTEGCQSCCFLQSLPRAVCVATHSALLFL